MHRVLLSNVMASPLLVFGLIIASCAISQLASAKKAISRADFPESFIFGTASAAYQYEGAANKSGRGPSIWDTFSQVKGNVLENANGNIAVDEYHRYKEDIEIMANMGMDAYRFSISWSRLYPEGKGKLNQIGVNYYNNLINGLLKKGIQPYVTLYHWDLPQSLEDSYKGWLSSKIVDDYANFVDTCFKNFGDRVKYWITFNEPSSFILSGYNDGTFPPQRCSLWIGHCKEGNSTVEPYIVQHNVLLSHAKAVDIYRTKYQKQQNGKVGITINSLWFIPLQESAKDAKAALRALDFIFGWSINPILYGEYPTIMKEILGDRLPTFTSKQKDKLKNSIDFLGLNYYTTYYASDVETLPNPSNSSFFQDSMTNLTTERDGVLIGPQAASSWLYIYPKGFYYLLKYIKSTYPTMPPIIITENGVDEKSNASLTLQQSLYDPIRIKYHKDHIYYLSLAIREGVDVRGYFAWSLLDNFEWTSGFSVRFGLNFVDYNTLKRYPKKSAKWFKKILQKRKD